MMSRPTQLEGGDFPVRVGTDGSSLQAPDLVGEVIEIELERDTGRADLKVFQDRLDVALKEADINYRKILEIAVRQDGMARGARKNRAGGLAATTRQDEPAIILRLPPGRPDCEYAVLYTDEAGMSRWIWAQRGLAPRATRGRGELVFHLPRRSAPLPPPKGVPRQRGLGTKFGRRVVRVLYWATDRVVGAGARKAAEYWENQRRPYAFRPFPALDGDGVRWNDLAAGRALLLLHGTFSSAACAFAELPADARASLAQFYGGRIFAFDHPSMHHSPQENADRFFDMLPRGADLELDVVTHSRGGLLARELIERRRDVTALGRNVRIHKAVFVASPNLGTKLADGDHGTDLLDAYTNLLTELPDDAFSFTIEGVLSLVKIVAHGALAELPGLNSMLPDGAYLTGLNVRSKYDTKYYAAAADFEPRGEGVLERYWAFLKDGFLFSIFNEQNDGVVPTRGCYDGVPQPDSFPVPAERLLLFGPGDDVHHCNYFGNIRLADHLVRWLTT
jgi:hypothetical protein